MRLVPAVRTVVPATVLLAAAALVPVVVTSGPADADDCGYTTDCDRVTVRTTAIDVLAGGRARITTSVDRPGASTPRGRVEVVVRGDGTVQRISRDLGRDGDTTVTTRHLAPGRYGVRTRFVAAPGSASPDKSSGTRYFRVR